MKSIEYTYHLNDIDSIAARILPQLNAKVIIINGEMGAGKTTFVNALLKAMQSNDVATSPTFSIVNEYTIPNDKVYHFDFYRIASIDEAYNFGVEDYLYSNHWLFIEWPERIKELLPEKFNTITITAIDTTNRKITLNT
ncbi:MAG: tRNA (adenosine(37)-N6)-threonylcarbamoyltransferase complex ATPase subunit type 1 TsaE [Winogradskyella sp.]